MPTPMLVLVLLLLGYSEGKIESMPMPSTMQDCFNRYSYKTNIVETVGESIASYCVDQYVWRATKQNAWLGFNVTREVYDWVHGLLGRRDLRRFKRQALPRNIRIRREYRRLTDQDRANFHRAMQLLKADTTILPTRYDALAAIHQGMMTEAAHGGPNFLAFHRVYILMFENALREKVPSVTLPYWDSTLDEPLRDPTQSIMFTETFLGDGQGLVNTGPFANWRTMSGPLTRNIGHSGQLFKAQDINRVVTSLRLARITEPLAPVNTSLEFLHNQVHLWIDGQMGTLSTASHDPVFWLHHAYVDYVWEIFRRNQRTFGIDPTRDYPLPVNNSMHLPGMSMGISNFRNIDGFSDVFTSRMYRYEPSPTCSQMFPDCGSPYLRCVVGRFRPMCVSQDWRVAPRPSPIFSMFTRQPVNMIPAMNFIAPPVTRQMTPIMARRQQMFNQITQQESMLKERENAGEDLKRKRRSEPDVMSDVYKHANGNGQTPGTNAHNVRIVPGQLNKRQMPAQTLIHPGNRSKYYPPPQTCPTIPTANGYQNTFNINGRSDIHQWVYIPVRIIYQRPPTYGKYTSFPVVDGEAEEGEDIYSPARYTNVNTMLQMGKPASYSHCRTTSGAGKVYVTSQGINYIGSYKEYAIVDHRLAISVSTAYVAVKSPERGLTEVVLSAYDECGRVCQPFCRSGTHSSFRRCPGTFRISSDLPKMYGTNFGEAISNLWTLTTGNEQCPTMSNDNIQIQFHCNFKETWPFMLNPAGPFNQSVAPSIEQERDAGGGRTTPTMKGATASGENKASGVCDIGHGCVISGPCRKCTNGKAYACAQTCADYATCQNGIYFIRRCPQNMWFDEDEQKCRPGTCFRNYRQLNTWRFLMQRN